MATVIAEVRTSGLFRTRRMPIFQMTAGQGRARLKCIWFNGTYLRDRFKPGQMVALYGKVEADRSGELQIVQPQFEILGDASEDGESRRAERLPVARSRPHRSHLRVGGPRPADPALVSPHHPPRSKTSRPTLPDPIPAAVRARMSLISPTEALWQVHWPDAGESLPDLQSSRTPAHIRLIFEELFFPRTGARITPAQQKAQTGIAFHLDDRVREAIKKILAVSSHGGAEARAEGNRRRHGEAVSHAAACCRATSDRARRSWPSKPRSSRSKTDTRSRSWRRPKFWRSSITFPRAGSWRMPDTASSC